ncbi:MAG: glycosyltransferase [Desulfobulbaceae bacterium]|nr:glycosyltransferase [Desulfobulbaceae bacterium]
MWTNCRLLLFTRYPEAGKTKTRLIPELGEGGAALLQKRLTERVAYQADLLSQRLGIKTVVHYAGGSREKMTRWLGLGLGPTVCVEQAEGDLGQRMRAAFELTFAGGVKAAVLIGSDIPDITTDLLQQAFTSLLSKEVVIGPSQDGGYYLIGLTDDKASQLLPLLFEEMQWSTGGLFATTTNRLEKSGYAVAVLPTLRDIDLPADLPFAAERGLL